MTTESVLDFNNFNSWDQLAPTTTTKINTNTWNNWQETATPRPTTTIPTSTTENVDNNYYKELFKNTAQNTTHAYASGDNGLDDNCMKCLCFIESWCSDVGCVWDQGSLSCGCMCIKY